MDLVRFGLVIRALRRRKGWRQVDLARKAGVSQDTVSMIERGHGDRLRHATLVHVAAELDARLTIEVRWRGGELGRLLDQDHAALVAAMVRILEMTGWTCQVEVTYAVYGELGSIDVLAWHERTSSLLVIEIKTEVTSGEATVRKLDEKVRLASRIALDRFGWNAATVSRLLVIEETTTARRRVAAGGGLFDVAFPSRAVAVRRWLRTPHGSVSGLTFLPPTNPQRRMSRSGGRHRVRRPADVAPTSHPNVAGRPEAGTSDADAMTIFTNRT